MKKTLLLFIFTGLLSLPALSQQSTLVRAGYGYVLAGKGDLPGKMLFLGVQKKFSRHTGIDILASGTYIEANSNFGGLVIPQKSNGVAVEVPYSLFLGAGRFSFYPSLGPTLRCAHEVFAENISIRSNGNLQIVEYSYDLRDEWQLQFGYLLALNADVRVSRNITLGFRGSVHRYFNGQQLAFVGLTLQNAHWRF